MFGPGWRPLLLERGAVGRDPPEHAPRVPRLEPTPVVGNRGHRRALQLARERSLTRGAGRTTHRRPSHGHGRGRTSSWGKAQKAIICGSFPHTERRRNRTFQPPGYDGLPVLKSSSVRNDSPLWRPTCGPSGRRMRQWMRQCRKRRGPVLAWARERRAFRTTHCRRGVLVRSRWALRRWRAERTRRGGRCSPSSRRTLVGGTAADDRRSWEAA
jgi:hypothetical protein